MAATDHPNILFILVDQLRAPQWYPNQSIVDSWLPNLAELRKGAISFDGFYTAATACTPARAALLTGLYTHQNGVLTTPYYREIMLNSGFPTWGSALRNEGYFTYWFGKWHVSNLDTLEPYGFAGGTFHPGPNGAPLQGAERDPGIVDQFLEWLDSEGDKGPWATTVSLLNPHDILYFPTVDRKFLAGKTILRPFQTLPPNFETQDAIVQHKPHLQEAFWHFSDSALGAMPDQGDGFETLYYDLQNSYLFYTQLADFQIGRVLNAVNNRPNVSENTIVVFTSDHGDYCGSHGLRGKAGGAYEEGIRVPLYVKDPTGRWATRPNIVRTQLLSMVDLFGLFLTLATGGNQWRSQPQYAYLSRRADIAAILRDPSAPGRPYILSTSDEPWGGEYKLPLFPEGVASHVIALRSDSAKLVSYNHWRHQALNILRAGQEFEVYDYSTEDGRAEIANDSMHNSDLQSKMEIELTQNAIPNELRQPLPLILKTVQEEAFNEYYTFIDTEKGLLADLLRDMSNSEWTDQLSKRLPADIDPRIEQGIAKQMPI